MTNNPQWLQEWKEMERLKQLPKQNTPEWLEWRKTKIGASDTPIIMELSPFMTPFQLYQQKKGITQTKTNPAMSRGHKLEPIARKLLEQRTGLQFFPTVLQGEVEFEDDHMIASLDGITMDGKYICEIKCPNKEVIEMAKRGEIPEYYMMQIQHQLCVSVADLCYYCCFDGHDIHVVEVTPDTLVHDDITRLTRVFLDNLEANCPPALTEADYWPVNNAEACRAAQRYAEAKRALDIAKKEEKEAKDLLISHGDDGNFVVGEGIADTPTVRCSRANREGNIDWKSVWETACKAHPDLEFEIDLQAFRKDQIGYYRITVEE